MAAWLRLDQLASQVLIEDEWHPVHQVIYYSLAHVLLSFGNADYSIPLTALYYLQSNAFGLSEMGLRLPAVIAGLAAVVVIPLALRLRSDDRIVLVLAVLLAVSPFLVSYSRIARSYAVTLLGTYAAFWLLERAIRDGGIAWRPAAGYCVLCGLVVWAHPITGPMLVAPIVMLWWSATRHSAMPWRSLALLTLLTALSMAFMVFPPLIGDPQALAGKSGVDTVTMDTVVGAWHLWLGTGSPWIAGTGLILAAVGFRTAWSSSPVIPWILTGTALTVAALLIARPWWVDRPLAFGRYLLPLLPVILLAISAGVVRTGDAATLLLRRSRPTHGAWVLAVVPLLLLGWWQYTPYPDLLRRPNSYTQHSYFQLDYRTAKNPIRRGLPNYPASPFWAMLASAAPGTLTIAVAPFHYATFEWPAPIWERASGQRIIPAFLWGTCEKSRHGEVPPDEGFRLDNAIHVLHAQSSSAPHIDYIAYYKGPQWQDFSPHMPHCEAWMRRRFGVPYHEDPALIVWKPRHIARQ